MITFLTETASSGESLDQDKTSFMQTLKSRRNLDVSAARGLVCQVEWA